MKVYKSVGAVAVYSKARATAVVAAAGLVVAGAGVAAGVALAGGDPEAAPAAAAPPPETVREPAPPERSSGPPSRAATKRAYRRGYRAGVSDVFPRGGTLEPGGAYVIRLAPGDGTPPRIGQRVPIEQGKTYYLCAGGTRLCIASG
jgi:hypothetical protein